MKSILEHPIYANKKQEFIGLWLVRYGSNWVEMDYSDESSDYFFYIADQLKKMGKLDIVYTPTGEVRCKLIKDE
jgi:TnpA family transposase